MMRPGLWLALLAMVVPGLAHAAETAVPGTGSGVWAAAGAFAGQLASSALFLRRELKRHEGLCRSFNPPREATDDA